MWGTIGYSPSSLQHREPVVHLPQHWVQHVPIKSMSNQKHFLSHRVTLRKSGGRLVPAAPIRELYTTSQSAKKLDFKNFKFTNFFELSIYWNKKHFRGGGDYP